MYIKYKIQPEWVERNLLLWEYGESQFSTNNNRQFEEEDHSNPGGEYHCRTDGIKNPEDKMTL